MKFSWWIYVNEFVVVTDVENDGDGDDDDDDDDEEEEQEEEEEDDDDDDDADGDGDDDDDDNDEEEEDEEDDDDDDDDDADGDGDGDDDDDDNDNDEEEEEDGDDDDDDDDVKVLTHDCCLNMLKLTARFSIWLSTNNICMIEIVSCCHRRKFRTVCQWPLEWCILGIKNCSNWQLTRTTTNWHWWYEIDAQNGTNTVIKQFKHIKHLMKSHCEKPMVAIMEMRPCFNSTDRRRLKTATSPSEVNPTGSQKPTGAWTPNSFSKAVKVTCNVWSKVEWLTQLTQVWSNMAHDGEKVRFSFCCLAICWSEGGNDIPFLCVFCTVSVSMYIRNEMEWNVMRCNVMQRVIPYL